MEMNDYLPRVIDARLDEYLQTFGAVCVEGSQVVRKNLDIPPPQQQRDFYRRSRWQFSESSVGGAFARSGAGRRCTPADRRVAGSSAALGRCALQGGSGTSKGTVYSDRLRDPNHKGILHSGAGRIARLRMRPMSLYESGDSSGKVSLERLCHGELTPAMTGDGNLKRLIDLIIRGGWPASIGMPAAQAALLPEEYLNAVIDDDVYRMDSIRRNTIKMRLLLRSLARNESTTATNKRLKNDIREVDDEDIDVETVKEYLDIFERLFIIENQPPFSAGMRSSIRVKQAVKRHFCDPSLACSLLKATPASLLGDLETLGFLFEALCERDLRIYAESFGAALYHYQDYRNREIDAVVELSDGRWCAFEIKLGANQIDAAAKNLLDIQREMTADPKGKPPVVLCVLCGMSNAAYRRADGVFVVPPTALKP